MTVEEIYLSKPGAAPKRSFRWVYKVKPTWWVLQRRRIIDDSLVNPSAQATKRKPIMLVVYGAGVGEWKIIIGRKT